MIDKKLNDITNIYIFGFNTLITLNENVFIGSISNCYLYGISFVSNNNNYLVENFNFSQFNNCIFMNVYYLFNQVSVIQGDQCSSVCILDKCDLENTNIIRCDTINDSKTNIIINNTFLNYDSDNSHISSIINGYINGKYIFNNCTITRNTGDNIIDLFNSVDSFEFNNCSIINKDNVNIFLLSNIKDVEKQQITFNNCNISSVNKYLVDVVPTNNTILPTVNIKYSNLDINTIFNAKNECSLWLENNQIDTKPIINAGVGKVNIVEIQQKYSDTSENIFPWTTEPTPTVENNVELGKYGINYYVLTENEDKTIKKLDYYLTYLQLYKKGMSNIKTGQVILGVDISGYTLKKSMLKNNIFKITGSVSELIDYVYMHLDNTKVSGGVLNDSPYIDIDMQFTPVVTKFTGNEETDGCIEVNTCITLILEKTSS